ncbi:MAG: 3-phosphoshikimate 1-carboxyvinyltransferase [Prevotella sp.]|nr:3-phosphoshikimate 1-carboxyvinyltransferase [Prevotella sp.]
MQHRIIAPRKLNADVTLPASKSISNRVLIIAELAGMSHTQIENLSDCDDTQVMIDALTQRPETMDIGAAGTAMRFLTALTAATPNAHHNLMGTERMCHRPIGILVDALRQLGADIRYLGSEGYPPLHVNGNRLSGGTIELPATVSSQYISALLLIGPMLEQGLTLRLKGNIISRPYIDLTLCIMRDFGADVEWTDTQTISVRPGCYKPRPYVVENDWSAASYWYEMMALSEGDDDQITLHGLMDGSKQGDSSLRYVFSLLGVKTQFATKNPEVPTTVTLRRKPFHVPRLDYDFSGQPDLAQTFVVCCCMMGVPFHFAGLSTLRIKETDRIVALQREMAKLGFNIEAVGNSELMWNGQRGPMHDTEGMTIIDTYHDHRMALSFAPAALRLPSLAVNDPTVVSKSYPRFWRDLTKAGFTVEDADLGTQPITRG